MNNEPSLDKIDDYNNNETPQKRKTVLLVVLFCLIVGGVYSYFKYSNSDQSDYVGTKENPGINIINK